MGLAHRLFTQQQRVHTEDRYEDLSIQFNWIPVIGATFNIYVFYTNRVYLNKLSGSLLKKKSWQWS